MNKIVRFEEFSKNEELFHGSAGSGYGEGGSDLLDPVFAGINRLFGDKGQIFNDLLNKAVARQVEKGEIKEEHAELVKSQVNTYTVDSVIKKTPKEKLPKLVMDKIEFVKKEILPTL